jgi:hypothetical protein
MSSWLNHPTKKRIPPTIPTINTSSEVVSTNNVVSDENCIYSNTTALNYTYEDTLNRLESFNKNNRNVLITFIIPTINRNTLINALHSLLNQYESNWKAIIVFDGIIPSDNKLLALLSDSRFLYISVNKVGKLKDSIGIHGTAGYVRNIGMSLVTTPWIGFLDDDDILLPNYTSNLMEEIVLTPSADLILFRMVDTNKIYPPSNVKKIISGLVGISFCFKTQLYQLGFKFKQSEHEDYYLIKDIQDAIHTIVMSPYITYIVRNSPIIDDPELTRIIIN